MIIKYRLDNPIPTLGDAIVESNLYNYDYSFSNSCD